MLSSLVKEHQAKQSARKESQGKKGTVEIGGVTYFVFGSWSNTFFHTSRTTVGKIYLGLFIINYFHCSINQNQQYIR